MPLRMNIQAASCLRGDASIKLYIDAPPGASGATAAKGTQGSDPD